MLKNDRVVLRPILKSDLEKLNNWKNDEETFKYLGGGFSPISINQQEKWLDNIINIDQKNKRYIISVDNIPIGMIGLYDINNINQNCEVGLYIGERSYSGKGYASEAYYTIEQYAKNYLNIRKIKLFVVDENKLAVKFWAKCGFLKIGTLKEERFIDGSFRDLSIMEKFI